MGPIQVGFCKYSNFFVFLESGCFSIGRILNKNKNKRGFSLLAQAANYCRGRYTRNLFANQKSLIQLRFVFFSSKLVSSHIHYFNVHLPKYSTTTIILQYFVKFFQYISFFLFSKVFKEHIMIHYLYRIFLYNAPSLLIAPPSLYLCKISGFYIPLNSQHQFWDKEKQCVLALPQSNTVREIKKSKQGMTVLITDELKLQKYKINLYRFFKFKVCFKYFKLSPLYILASEIKAKCPLSPISTGLKG